MEGVYEGFFGCIVLCAEGCMYINRNILRHHS